MTDHDDATRALLAAMWTVLRPQGRGSSLFPEDAGAIVAALAESGHGIARQEVIEAGEAVARLEASAPEGYGHGHYTTGDGVTAYWGAIGASDITGSGPTFAEAVAALEADR